ncbi:hypothetical protein [Amycolatopsis anabasis]|uniref:hypothetical protein n=1 Tax=Amycolatopsis anabasis TaxID=1840409 RepID=UPI00131E4AD5|nr:hypothetical protein [Amycolatopsis anabasis]
MPVIHPDHPDLRITRTPARFTAASSSLRGHLDTTYARLAEVFGPDLNAHDTRLAARWEIATPAGVLCVYDHDRTREPDQRRRWHIGAHDDRPLPWLHKAVHRTTQTLPTGARPFFTDSRLSTYLAAYIDYLELRSHALHQWRRDHEVLSSGRRRSQHLPAQLRRAAAELRQLLLVHRGSRTVDASNRSRPHHWFQPDHDSSKLVSSRPRVCCPFTPLTKDIDASTDSSDLAGMLRAYVRFRVRSRPFLRLVAPHIVWSAYDEDVATVRALATVAVPELRIRNPGDR